MPTLTLNQGGRLCQTLRGAADDPILTTFRHWPHWRDAVIERDPKTRQCVAVTLITDRTYEPTVRAILRRSFGIICPDFEPAPRPSPAPPPPDLKRRRR